MNREERERYMASREWALKREAVRRRSKDRCERCGQRPMDAVHHLTYEHFGDEPLEDLQAVCDPCHEFLSGKRNTDPAVRQTFVYLAGKIGMRDWRQSIFPSLRDHGPDGRPDEWCQKDEFTMTGPYFLSCDHGCYHGEGTHGVGAGQEREGPGGAFRGCGTYEGHSQHAIASICRDQIYFSDVVFCWLNSPTAYGTIAELGYARGIGKSIFIAYESGNPVWSDTWFVREFAKKTIQVESAQDGWAQFTSWWSQGAQPKVRPWEVDPFDPANQQIVTRYLDVARLRAGGRPRKVPLWGRD